MKTEKLVIPASEFESRLQKTLAVLRAKDLDGLIAFSSYQEREGHVCYLTNHHISFPNGMSHVGLGHAAYILTADGKGFLISPLGYERHKVVNVHYAKTGNNLVADIVAVLKSNFEGEKRLGIVGMDVIPAEYYLNLEKAVPELKFEAANAILEDQRIIKSSNEVEILREAARIVDIGLQAGMEAVKEGITQLDVEFAAREALMKAGADFIPRVRISSGPAIETLSWPMTKNIELKKGDFVYLDLIGWYSNYGFDNSRVTVVGGPSDAQRNYLDHLVEATEWMIGALKPHKEMGFNMTESRGRHIIPLGHGIGLEICENPWVSMGNRFTLEPNMVMCIEPIIVTREFGGMTIEDTVVVTETGVEVLNQCPMAFW
ncbi:MAG: M24 family metallopeptidase [Anaerolineaceae bacterium]|nr:M24 family metallopeptidase [Anaerolineaceae bacterium]